MFDSALLERVSDVTFASQPEWCRPVPFLLQSFGFDPALQRRLALLDGEPVGYAS